MKAIEAKEKTNKAKYKMVMERINIAIESGEKTYKLEEYALRSFFEEPEAIIELLLKDGYDLTLCYIGEELKSMIISWENSKEGRRGERFTERKPVKKPNFFERVENFFSSLGTE